MNIKRLISSFAERGYPFIVMKGFFLFSLLFIFCINIYTQNSQSKDNEFISLDINNMSLSDVLRKVEELSSFKIRFNDDDVNLYHISVKIENLQIKKALDTILNKVSGRPLEYDISGTMITVKKRKSANLNQDYPQAKGFVSDESGYPLPGVSVTIKGTLTGSSSDVDGYFTLSIPKGIQNPILVFTFVGMTAKEVPYTGQYLDIQMKDNHLALSEVIVTGVFNKPRESYTGAVAQISSEELKRYRGQNFVTTLANIDPSINIAVDNLSGSNPNSLPDITIRGNSSLPTSIEELNSGATAQLNVPLIIMDGFEIPLSKLVDFNEENIADVVILKDASATAIYGSKGANGVIVINTVKPTSGNLRTKFKAGFNIETPDLSSYNMMNSKEKLHLEWVVGLYNAINDPIKDNTLKEIYYSKYADVLRGVDTDWLSQPLQTAIGQRYNFQLDYGTSQFQVGVSLSYNNVEGVMKGSKRNTTGAVITLSYKHGNVLFRNRTSGDFNKSYNGKYGNFSNYVKMNPYWKIYDDDGNFIKSYTVDEDKIVGNPLYNASLNIVDQNQYTTLINNLSIEWNILKNLTFRGNLGLQRQTTNSDNFLPPEHTAFPSSSNILKRGKYTYTTGETNQISGNVSLNYSQVWNKLHILYVGLHSSMREANKHLYKVVGQGFTSGEFPFLPSALQYEQGKKPDGTESKERSVGFTGNINYTYDNRYYVDASYRIDGSSLFGSGSRFAPFWSVGLGWNLHKELFLQKNKFIDRLRVKASLGETGSQNFKPYQALTTYSYYSDKRYILWTGARMKALGNSNLRWQSTMQENIGIELGLLDSRITTSIDIYKKKTKDLLSAMDLTLATGFSSYIANVGKVENKGFEAAVSGYIIRNTKQDIAWSVTAKISYNKNVITKLSDAIKAQNEIYLNDNTEINNLLFEGDSSNSIYAVPSLGIDPSTGQEIFLDKNDNITSTWNASDKRYFGVSQPAYRGNIGTYFSYKGLSVNLSFAYHWGGQLYNNTLLDRVEVTTYDIAQRNVDKRVYEDRWQKPGDVKPFKSYNSKSITKVSSRFVMNDRVFQFQSANINYRWGKSSLLNKIGVHSLVFGANMSDIFYWSSVKQERGTNYPFSRRFGFDITVTF